MVADHHLSCTVLRKSGLSMAEIRASLMHNVAGINQDLYDTHELQSLTVDHFGLRVLTAPVVSLLCLRTLEFNARYSTFTLKGMRSGRARSFE